MQRSIRCVIIDIDGEVISSEYPDVVARTPEVSKPYIGERGVAEAEEWGIKITLDNGNIIYGHECWWMPEKEYDKREGL